MNKQRVLSAATQRQIKPLEITQAYAEYKLRHAGDLDNDLAYWPQNVMRFIQLEKAKR